VPATNRYVSAVNRPTSDDSNRPSEELRSLHGEQSGQADRTRRFQTEPYSLTTLPLLHWTAEPVQFDVTAKRGHLLALQPKKKMFFSRGRATVAPGHTHVAVDLHQRTVLQSFQRHSLRPHDRDYDRQRDTNHRSRAKFSLATMSLFKRVTVAQKDALPPSMESKSAHKEKLALAAAAELEALEADEVRRPLQAATKRSSPPQSSIAVAAASSGVKKKRSDVNVPSRIIAVPPPIPPRNGSLLGGRQQKPPGIVFSACYDDSSVIGRILSKVENLSSEFTLLFTRAGLTITLLDTSHVTLLAVNVPAESFLQYANLQSKPISFTVNSKAWCRFAKICQSDRTLTFVYDQCTLDSEPLHLMLFPPSGSGQSSYVSPMAIDDGIVQPNSEYQYEVCVSSRQFFKNVANLGTEDDTVRLRLSAAAFELAALSPGGEQIAFHSIPVGDAPSDGCCTIKRIGSAASNADLAQFANFRMSAVYLLSACAFGNNSECDWLTLRFGVTVGAGASASRSHSTCAFRCARARRRARLTCSFGSRRK
jgi:hypothetical protein